MDCEEYSLSEPLDDPRARLKILTAINNDLVGDADDSIRRLPTRHHWPDIEFCFESREFESGTTSGQASTSRIAWT